MNGSTNVLAIAGDISLFGLRAGTLHNYRRYIGGVERSRCRHRARIARSCPQCFRDSTETFVAITDREGMSDHRYGT